MPKLTSALRPAVALPVLVHSLGACASSPPDGADDSSLETASATRSDSALATLTRARAIDSECGSALSESEAKAVGWRLCHGTGACEAMSADLIAALDDAALQSDVGSRV